MKKKLFLGMAAIAIALAAGFTVKTVVRQNVDPLKMNLEALADGEYTGTGTCAKSENDCIFTCPGCGSSTYATTGVSGPIATYRCNCGFRL